MSEASELRLRKEFICLYCTAGKESHSRRCPGVLWDGEEVRRCARRRAHAGLCEYRPPLRKVVPLPRASRG